MSTFEDLMSTLKGFTLVRPWAGERRKVGSSGFACYVLVPHHTGLSLDEVEKMLTRHRRQHHWVEFCPSIAVRLDL